MSAPDPSGALRFKGLAGSGAEALIAGSIPSAPVENEKSSGPWEVAISHGPESGSAAVAWYALRIELTYSHGC
jgi:hypothetical protein